MTDEKAPSTALTPVQNAAINEVGALGKIFGMTTPGDVLADVLTRTAFSGDTIPTPEQLVALVVVARQYRLNPFTKEIYAFPDKKRGIVPIVGVDGWSRIINEHPAFDGMEFRQSKEMTMIEASAKEAPEWMECVMYRKDREHPIVIREYLDEVYRKRGNYDSPWQTHTKRFFRHKTMIQCARVAFGFAGIYDQDEAERILEGQEIELEGNSQRLPQRPQARSDRPAQNGDSNTGDRARAGQEPEDAVFETIEPEYTGTEPEMRGDEPGTAVQEEPEQPLRRRAPSKAQAAPATADDDWTPEQGQASKGMIDFIRRKAGEKGIETGEILERFELTALNGMSEEKGNEILAWVKTRAPMTTEPA